MPLELSKVAAQLEGMAVRLKAGIEQRRQHLEQAFGIINIKAIDPEGLKRKIARSKTTWLVADIVEEPNRHYQPPPPPEDFTIIATDGSHIDVNRHQSTRYYLINIGSVMLSYGSNPDAKIESHPRLYFEEEDLVLSPPEGGGREQPIEGALLGIKRGIKECRHLADIAGELPAGSSALALLDGSLIIWGLSSKDYPEFVVDELLIKGFLCHLEDIKKLNKYRPLALASYISFPRSTDVVNTLRVAICPYDSPDCDRYCSNLPPGKRECDAVAGVRDRDLFFNILNDGERSSLFINQSSIVRNYYSDQRIYFFYIRVGDEIARIEIPQWVAMDEKLLGLAHSLILDQCQRGHGYPVALSEAHEQAVLTAADRNNFQQLVELLLAEEHIPVTSSVKSLSKRTRWV
ncbi:MAG TPA: DNA double-strand break repair nuclease NurA [Dehalococcoidia bacterium]|nr:DNA double-strand break repair nuclease NurA [Dehalococcoidia bacterium]